eukprot:1323042-Amorphochlora_amoeboformis.AAC.1
MVYFFSIITAPLRGGLYSRPVGYSGIGMGKGGKVRVGSVGLGYELGLALGGQGLCQGKREGQGLSRIRCKVVDDTVVRIGVPVSPSGLESRTRTD